MRIIINNLSKLIKIVAYLCNYCSEHCLAAVKQMDMLKIIQQLFTRELSKNKSGVNVLTETLSLLSALIPDSKSYQTESTDYSKNEKAKSMVFEQEESNEYMLTLVESILPSMLKLFVSSMNTNVKYSFLQLIEEIVQMLSGETLRTYMQPYSFSRFVITTMKSENYTWIEICLKILQVLVDKKVTSCNIALQREGIQEYLDVFADKAKFKELTGIQIPDDEPPAEEAKQPAQEISLAESKPEATSAESQPVEEVKESAQEALPAEGKAEEVKSNDQANSEPQKILEEGAKQVKEHPQEELKNEPIEIVVEAHAEKAEEELKEQPGKELAQTPDVEVKAQPIEEVKVEQISEKPEEVVEAQVTEQVHPSEAKPLENEQKQDEEEKEPLLPSQAPKAEIVKEGTTEEASKMYKEDNSKE